MLHHVVVAAKSLPSEKAIALAEVNQLGYEIPDFVSPELLQNPDKAIAQWKKDLANVPGMLTLHGPVYDLNPVSWDPQIAEASRLRYRQAAEVCKALGCKYLVVHSQYSPIFAAANVKDEWMSESIVYWQQFAEEVLEDTGLSVVLENFMEAEPDMLRTLVDGIDHPHVKACLDTGHANIFSKVSLVQWMDTLESQLVYVHSHNNHGAWDEHRGYQYGTAPMEEFLSHLVNVPYKITLALEIFNEPELLESYETVKRFLTIQEETLPEKTFLI